MTAIDVELMQKELVREIMETRNADILGKIRRSVGRIMAAERRRWPQAGPFSAGEIDSRIDASERCFETGDVVPSEDVLGGMRRILLE